MNKNVTEKIAILQDALNEYITKDWKQNRTELDFMVASTLEMAELIDTKIEKDGKKYDTGWKWWKSISNTERTMDVVNWELLHPEVVNNIKIELTDLLFFNLSQKGLNDHTDPDEFTQISDNDWLNFMSIVANSLLQRPGASLMLILQLAEKLKFNITAYYCAKHLLNYYRQLDGYKDGSYQKVVDGKEDNESLHDIIEGITNDDFDKDFDATYNLIAERFFKVFKTTSENEVTFDFWVNILK